MADLVPAVLAGDERVHFFAGQLDHLGVQPPELDQHPEEPGEPSQHLRAHMDAVQQHVDDLHKSTEKIERERERKRDARVVVTDLR